MHQPVITEQLSDSCENLFAQLAHTPYFVYLDSSDHHSKWAHYSIMAFCPDTTLTVRGTQVALSRSGTIEQIAPNPISILQELYEKCPIPTLPFDSPFHGGLIGYMGYEFSHHTLDHIPTPTPSPIPTLIFGVYHTFIVVNHHTNHIHWVYIPPAQNAPHPTSWQDFVSALPQPPTPMASFSCTPPQSATTIDDFSRMVHTAQHHIQEGDIYQANLTHRFSSEFSGSISELYPVLRQQAPSPFGAYLNFPDTTILSTSPERFFSIHDQTIQTRPIKGTRPRGTTQQDDNAQHHALSCSEKDHAELLMITDLMRNDLGQLCVPGSIQVPDLMSIESFSNVHHLISTITGTLMPNTTLQQVFKALFPGGSITGAPKRRALEVIQQLEPTPRAVYTGTIGYWSATGNADFNIAIRTLYTHLNTLYFHVGAGITVGSNAASEWQETLDKARSILCTLNTFLEPQLIGTAR